MNKLKNNTCLHTCMFKYKCLDHSELSICKMSVNWPELFSVFWRNRKIFRKEACKYVCYYGQTDLGLMLHAWSNSWPIIIFQMDLNIFARTFPKWKPSKCYKTNFKRKWIKELTCNHPMRVFWKLFRKLELHLLPQELHAFQCIPNKKKTFKKEFVSHNFTLVSWGF